MNEKYKRLKEPLTAQDIELRVGTVGEKGVTLLLYKTARVDLKRLDDVFELTWQRHHYIDSKGNVVCKISIYDTDLKEWISREDVGTESNTEKEKGAYSDSFKRAGSSWGIGVELYNAPFIFVKCETVGKGDKNKYGKYNSYELKEKYYFNSDVVVTKFVVVNSEVFVEIKKKNDVLFTNFNANTQQNINEKKQEKPTEQNTQQLIKTKEEAKPVAENPQRKITNNERDELLALISDAQKDVSKLCNHYKVTAISELSYIQYASAKAVCEKAINDMN